MHRYQPRIHVVQSSDIYQLQYQTFHTFAFPECQFIAVTAYQNTQVSSLPYHGGKIRREKLPSDTKEIIKILPVIQSYVEFL